MLGQLIIEKQARGKIIILDTLKKFTSLMDKKSCANFGIKIREFISHGGTIIALAHTNKNRSDDGKLIFEGTGDITNDVDCYYTIDNNITDGNVGARKQRSVRDNIFVISAIINSVTRGSSPPIQVQVMDVEKCFDKLWLQACINALYEAGIDHDHLNLLYIENKQAQIAVKINDKLSARIKVSDLVMQGSVWGSIKCTTLMDKLNKNAMSDKSLQYYYKQDPNIPIGILGMVDDTLAVADCGNKAIRKNAVVNSFAETQRLTFSKDKSQVLQVGKESQWNLPCPVLMVHKDNMKKEGTTKHLGNILSTKGGLAETIEDRRNKGWG
jgi:hypothetical protein